MNKKVNAYVKKLKEPHKGIVQALRQLIHRTLPDIKEEYKWSTPFYPPVCYIAVHRDWVNLGFSYGSLLPHKYGIRLQGTGKLMRYMKIRKLSDIKKRPLAMLMREAMIIYESHR